MGLNIYGINTITDAMSIVARYTFSANATMRIVICMSVLEIYNAADGALFLFSRANMRGNTPS